MTVPQNPLRPTPSADPGLPWVRLDVRIGSMRPVGHSIPETGFTIGGGESCQLRLPGTHLPPQLARFDRTPAGLLLSRLAPAFPILVNGNPISGTSPVPVQHGDSIAIGSADITVNIAGTGYLHPTFVPISPPPPSGSGANRPHSQAEPGVLPFPESNASAAEEAARIRAKREELERFRASLEEQARELAADRVLWYRRREELEREFQAKQHSLLPAAVPQAALAVREQELFTREQEIARTREELAAIRQELLTQYHARREQLVRYQEQLQAESAELDERRAELDSGLAERRAELEAAWARDAGERWRQLQEEFDAEVRSLEPRIGELHTRQQQLAAAFAELDAQRESLAQDRTALDAERALEDTRRQENDRLFTSRDAELTRREEQLLLDRAALDADRDRYTADLLHLDRRRGELDERQQSLDRRAVEVDQRVEQLVRDTAELEDHVRLADAEQARITAEVDRLDRLRTDLETRAADLADKSARLEAQQAMLAVLRAKLDRQQDDFRQEAGRLAVDRTRQDEARAELQAKIREAETLRDELAAARNGQVEQEQAITERSAVLEVALKELAEQQDAANQTAARLALREEELDVRSTELAEQTATLKARLEQVLDLQARLEADRLAVRERELTLTDADFARATFQEQLRKRSEELAQRARQLDEDAATLADEKAAIERLRNELHHDRERALIELGTVRDEVASRVHSHERDLSTLSEEKTALERQTAKLRAMGRALAAGKKQFALMRKQLEADRLSIGEEQRLAREELDQFRAAMFAELGQLRRETPDLEDRAAAAQERLAAARDVLRGQIDELHQFAAQSRAELESTRQSLQQEREQIREREQAIEKARAEHRHAVAQFRQQLVEWQARIAEIKQAMTRNANRLDSQQAELVESTRTLDITTQDLARQAEELRAERQRVAERRSEVERHLADMREWYRKKLHQLAASSAERVVPPTESDSEPNPIAGRVGPTSPDDVDPGDRQLGELLKSLDLVDDNSLAALWGEANRQRRTLRQVLLASGVVTLYQLALIEAGDLDALMIGRFRVVDRVRVTPRESVYRVFDPNFTEGPNRGLFLLRHLAESEAHDALHPDEFCQRFGALRDAAHPNLAGTLEVLELGGRPAALQEWVTGIPGSDWPPNVAIPGVWVRLVAGAAAGLDAAHRIGLVHGRMTSDAFVLTPNGTVKIVGVGEPSWLLNGTEPDSEPTTLSDLRALGQILFAWSQLAQSGPKKRGRGKGFPEPLLDVIRRLEADPDTPMSDTVPGAEPYRTASELVSDLSRLSGMYPCATADWQALLRYVAENATDGITPLRRSA